MATRRSLMWGSVLLPLLAACASSEVHYVAKSSAMHINSARNVVESALKSNVVGVDGSSGVARVHEVRFRKSGFGVAMQTSNVDWVSLFNDYKHSAPGVRACQLSEEPANPVTIKIGGLGGIGCSRYFVHTCGMNVFFCDSNSAEQFTEALYALKAYSVQ